MTRAEAFNKAARLANKHPDAIIVVCEVEEEFGTSWDAAREDLAAEWEDQGYVRQWIEWSAA